MEFKAGDRVKVYGSVEVDGKWHSTFYKGTPGTIEKMADHVAMPGAAFVALDVFGGEVFLVSSRQLRRLKSKAPKPPTPACEWVQVLGGSPDKANSSILDAFKRQFGGHMVRVRVEVINQKGKA